MCHQYVIGEDAWLRITHTVSSLKYLMVMKNHPLEVKILWASTREIVADFVRLRRKCARKVVYLFNIIVGKVS